MPIDVIIGLVFMVLAVVLVVCGALMLRKHRRGDVPGRIMPPRPPRTVGTVTELRPRSGSGMRIPSSGGSSSTNAATYLATGLLLGSTTGDTTCAPSDSGGGGGPDFGGGGGGGDCGGGGGSF